MAKHRYDQMLEHFDGTRLPAELRNVNSDFEQLATRLLVQYGNHGGAELMAALRKLLESRDCALRCEQMRPKERLRVIDPEP